MSLTAVSWNCHRRAITVALAFVFPLVAAAPEPLVGTWRLERQELNGEKVNFEPLTLKISQSGAQLTFAFSVPVNSVYFVSMSYTLSLNGSEADIKNGRGEKVGTIQMKNDGPSQYRLVMKGPNHPDSSGKLFVSPDGKSLTSDADSEQSGRTVHSRQVFSRY
ncbi:MAG: hypothetical protein JO336_11765 [Acidobacteriia bacterium]|nr:hypothetical protein [Terriglobia bacterium]